MNTRSFLALALALLAALGASCQLDATAVRAPAAPVPDNAAPPLSNAEPVPGNAEPAQGNAAPIPGNAEPAQWIWGTDEIGARETIFLRRVFEVPAAVSAAEIVGTCDNAWVAFLDGEDVAGDGQWTDVTGADVTEVITDLGAGRHVLAVRASNEGGPAGLVLRLTLEHGGADGAGRAESHEIVTDGSWRWSRTASEGWTTPGFTADTSNGWSPVALLGEPGVAPWTQIDARSLATTHEVRAPRATPPERISVPPGFEVELLHSVKRSQGSWVSLAVGPGDRLYASDQGAAGLFRIDVSRTPAQVERVDVDVSGAQGMTWAADGLYAVAHGADGRGLYKLTDTNGDDRLDAAEQLRALGGADGEHGWHAVEPAPDGRSLYVVGGNQTDLTELSASRVPPVWGEDQLLPRLRDASGFMVDAQAPGGCIYRVSLDGADWELVSVGYRNPYDVAFDARGDLFTFDADMEWDINTPWYRPTRVCLVTSGSEYGWRNGSGKRPTHFPDNLPAVLDVGPGSPVGMVFGTRTRFREPYRRALFLGDWSYGRIYAAHLEPDGAAVRGSYDVFASGAPLPVTDLVTPSDGALYFVTGGRGVPSGLYRVRDLQGAADVATNADEAGATEARRLRLALESFHGGTHDGAVDAAWPHLDHADRFVRFAARTTVEWQPVDRWRDRALGEADPEKAVAALIALARVGGTDPEHEGPGDATAALFRSGTFSPFVAGTSPAQAEALFAALGRVDWSALHETGRLDLVRAYGLAAIRTGPLDDARREAVLQRVAAWPPGGTARLETALCELLVFLRSPDVVARALNRIETAPTQEERLALLASLRLAEEGWTPALRQRYFHWLNRAQGYAGGMSFAGFVRDIRDEAIARLNDQQREELRATLEATPPSSPLSVMQSSLSGRTTVREWTLRELAPGVQQRLVDRDFARGRRMFGAASCFACHRLAGEGGAVGPDLTGAGGRFGPGDLLEATLEPSRTVSDQYQRVTVRKLDGDVVTGLIVNLSGNVLHISTDMFRPSQITKVDTRHVESMEPSAVSAMPAGLLDLLTRDEIDDLLAYILSGGRADDPMFQAGDEGAR